MKAYFVTSNDVENLKTALGRMIEYAKYLENDVCGGVASFADEILSEEEITVTIEEN